MSTVFAGPARVLVGYCGGLGIDLSDVLRDTPGDLFAAPEARISAALSDALWQRAIRAAQDPALALRVAEAVPTGTYRVLYFLCANAATVGDAFALVGAYSRWTDDQAQVRVFEQAEHVAVEFGSGTAQGCASAPEYALAACYLGVRRATCVDFRPHRVEIACARRADPREAERVFGCRVRYERAQTRLWFTRETWRRAVPGRNDALREVLATHADWLLTTLPAAPAEPAIVRRVREVLRASLSEGPLSLHDVARVLGISTRGMQRSLAEANTSFLRVLSEARMEVARELLANRTLSIAEIALRLGFSEQSAFTRAHKRWSGLPPIKARPTSQRGRAAPV